MIAALENMVYAKLNGEEVTLSLPRDDPWITAMFDLRGGTLAVFQRAMTGLLTEREMIDVIGCAFPSGKSGFMKGQLKIEEVLQKRGRGPYAPLALKVLEANLFGLVADEAKFTDERAPA